MISIGGHETPLAAFSELARRIYEEGGNRTFAVHLGRLIDSGASRVALTRDEERKLLLALQRHDVLGLEELRQHLIDRASRRSFV